jgi:hypothetical protein
LLESLAHIEVAELDASVLGEEDVGGLEIAVDNCELVKVLEGFTHLNQVTPNDSLADVLPPLAVALYLGAEIAAPCVLHDNAKLAFVRVEESFEEPNNVRVPDTGQEADLIQGIADLLPLHVLDAHALQRIDFAVGLSDGLCVLEK